MREAAHCWICESTLGPFYIKGYGTENEFKLCGSCCGTMAAIDSRLYVINKFGKLDDCFTAKDENVPFCEKDETYEKDEEDLN